MGRRAGDRRVGKAGASSQIDGGVQMARPADGQMDRCTRTGRCGESAGRMGVQRGRADGQYEG